VSETPAKKPEKGSLLRSGLIVSGFTLISRISGFARDQIVAVNFGASPVMDAFFVAFKIPNLLRRLFGEGAFAKGFVPVFTEYRETRSHEELQQLLSYVLGTLGGVLLLLSAVAVAAAPLLVLMFAPGFADEPERLEAATYMLRITFPYLFFISLVAAAGGVFQSVGRFAVPAFTPVILNVSMICAAIFLAPHLEQPVVALAWGVFLGGVLQLLFQ
jgi:putative peptidoglycan lipid II flippase